MKTAWLSALLALIMVGSAEAGNRIQITASLDTASHEVSGWVTVTWPSLAEPLDDMRIRLYANMTARESGERRVEADSANMSVDSLTVNDENLIDVSNVNNTDLYVPFKQPSMVGESLQVRLHFTTRIASLTSGIDRLFHSGNSYFLDGWFPMPAPRRSGRWLQVDYSSPLVELVADFFDFEVEFTAPKTTGVFGAGSLSSDTVGEQVTHRFALTSAHDFALYLSQELEVHRYVRGPAAVSVYTSEKSAFMANRIADVCGQTIECMGKMVAPYPFAELHVIVSELGFVGGIELPRMIICTEPMSARFPGLRDIVTIHEVVHQWFYGIVNSDQANTPFLDETITDYFTARVSRELYGEHGLVDWWGWRSDYAGMQRLQGLNAFDRLPITLPAAQYYSPVTYSATVYNKGSVILQTIFAQMQPGDEDEFWHRYFERFKFATPSETDFVSLMSEYQPFVGTTVVSDLLHSTKAIDYVIEQISNEPLASNAKAADSTAGKNEVSDQVRSVINYAMYNPIDLPVTLRLSFADGSSRDTTVGPHEGQSELVLTGSQPIVAAAIDPEYKFGLDRNLLNNSLTLKSNSSSLRLFSGITFLMESLLSYLWGW